ncbi:hypothetical protein BN59_01091 [Legionella massiliensis]|uniref:Uncharacterized protein n=1 Tax=Legionella massiliensis TaxID=1034943 RepID=A0A078KQX5_9GAMM|nr:hypothetical protein [Legionella massiliensis]CDZ76815.1 hypothetical protein BN59_01091 [Legionella massiliensis]CEE12553.1 hypothetical protein BN1094_01091 [Legionella massiliensis]
MTEELQNNQNMNMPQSGKISKTLRAALQVSGGAIPFAGGVLSTIASAWSESEQSRANRFVEQWIRMLEDEIREKEQTIIEIIARLDLQDDKIAKRVESTEYQSLVRKTFREWSGAESIEKRLYIRNILANAASTNISSDDVIRLFIDWINKYSVLHFQIVGAIYNSKGISRGAIWAKIGKEKVRENSADADLYKLIFRELSTGGIIRQHRYTDNQGNFIKLTPRKSNRDDSILKSAFDEQDLYELTELGQQFIHYAMTDLPPRIGFNPGFNDGDAN